MRKLWTPDVLRTSAAVLVAFAIVAIQLGRHVRLSASTARVIPTHIEPSFVTMENGGKIFDAVIRGDWTRDDNVSVRLIGYHYPGMLWDWEVFHCRFIYGGHTSAGAMYHDFIDRHRQPFCPVPEGVLKAMQRGELETLILSIYTGANETELIVRDVVVKLYMRGHHKTAVINQVQNEGAAYIEWLEYHRMLGIEHFYVYDNNSTDGLLPRLRRYMDAGIVTYIWWPYRYEEGMRRNQIQNAGLNHFVMNFGPFNDWVGFFDVDEYFQLNETYADAVIAGSAALPELLDAELAKPRAEDGLLCHALQFQMWQIYCALTFGRIRHARDSLLIDNCRQIDPEVVQDVPTMHVHGKMWIKVENLMAMNNIHSLGHHVQGGKDPTKRVIWPSFGRIRHYRALIRRKGKLEFTQGTDESMDRYLEPLRRRVNDVMTCA